MILKYVIVGLMVAGGIHANAQNQETETNTKEKVRKVKSPAEKIDKKVANLTTKLALTEVQGAEVKVLMLDLVKNIDAIKNDATIQDADKKSKIKEHKSQFETSFLAKLDDSQKEKLEALKAERQAKKAVKRADRKEEKNAQMKAELATRLSLTAEQAEKLNALQLRVAEKNKAIRSNDALDKAKKKELIKGNKEDHKKEMSIILTADQLIEYEAMVAEKKAAHKKKKCEKKDKK